MQQAATDMYPDEYAAYPAQSYNGYNEYPPQQYGVGHQAPYPGHQEPYSDLAPGAIAGGMVGAGAAGVGAAGLPAGNPAAAALGIHDNMMVRVKVAFVRSLEDELGESKDLFSGQGRES
jgi:hypothetical protein